MRKEKYIQLPPIPEELDGNVVRMIWEYTKLPEKERQFVYEQYKVLSDDSSSESDVNAVLTRYSKNSPTSLGGEMNCKKYKRTLVLRCRMWYNIISRIKERIDYNMDLDNNAHSVFLLYYHLIMVVKYRRKVIDDVISNRCELRNQHS